MQSPLPAREPRVRTLKRSRPVRILVANAKGGSGKTTIAINLASQFARQGLVTALLDCDPQESAHRWLRIREEHLPLIHGVAVCRERQGGFSNLRWRLRVPLSTERVIIDTPAGLAGPELEIYMEYADIIIIPVVPSAIDMRAAAEYLDEINRLKLEHQKIALIANRVRRNTLVSGKLQQFLTGLNHPSVATLRDTQFYLRACELGYGLADFTRQHEQDVKEWNPLIQWLDQECQTVIERDLEALNQQESSA